MTQYNGFDENDGMGFLGSIGPKAAFFIVLIALSFMIGLVWKLYTGGGDTTQANVPIVRADQDGFKVAPEDRGGMEIPYQDSTLFNSDKNDDLIENLLAENNDEPPMPRSQLFSGLSTEEEESAGDIQSEIQDISVDEPKDEGEERIVEQVREAEKIVETIVVEEKIENPPVLEPIKAAPEKQEAVVIPEKVEPVIEAKPAPKPVVKEVTSPPPSGDYYIQLASVQSKPAAEGEWQKFVKKYSPALNGYNYRIETADLGAKGVYHRIQAGPTSKSRADATCATIKRTNPNGCLVKKK